MYRIATLSCRKILVKLRYAPYVYASVCAFTPETRAVLPSIPHQHTLSNLRRVNKALQLEVDQTSYRYMPAVVVLPSMSLHKAPDPRSIALGYETEIKKYQIIALKLYDKSRRRTAQHKEELRDFLRWWDTTSHEGHPNTQLRISPIRDMKGLRFPGL